MTPSKERSAVSGELRKQNRSVTDRNSIRKDRTMSNPRGSMTFSAVLKEVDVTTTGADGVEKKYVLRELVGRSRDQFMNAFRDRAKFDSEGNMTGLSTYEGSQSSLLSVCLYDEADNLVPETIIQEFPVTMLEGLFDMAQEISGLNKDAKKKSKND